MRQVYYSFDRGIWGSYDGNGYTDVLRGARILTTTANRDDHYLLSEVHNWGQDVFVTLLKNNNNYSNNSDSNNENIQLKIRPSNIALTWIALNSCNVFLKLRIFRVISLAPQASNYVTPLHLSTGINKYLL